MSLIALCIFCRGLAFGDRPICRTCEGLLKKRLRSEIQDPRVFQCQRLPIKHLVTWKQDRDPELSRLLEVLKGGNNSELWSDPANYFFDKYALELVKNIQDTCLLPVPSRRKVKEDHAEYWGRALSLRTGIPMIRGAAGDLEETKKLSRKDRLLQSRSWKLSVPSKFKQVMIVDDIVTTGATARSVADALAGTGVRCQIWAFCHRLSGKQHLASNSRFC